jgi:signal transduction histidine kinase
LKGIALRNQKLPAGGAIIPLEAMWPRIYDYLFPQAAERDPAFRREILRLSRVALLVIGGIQIGVSLFMLAARFFVVPESSTLPLRLKQGGLIVALGLLNVALSRVKKIQTWARLLASVSGLLTVTILIWSSLLTYSTVTNPDDFIPGQITLIMLVAITTVPLQPLHTFWTGAAIGGIYIGSTIYAQRYLNEGNGPDDNYILFILMLTLLCTGLTVVVYRQRVSNFELRQAQTRSLLAENASSMARLAAALSHELNNPVGALLSGVDTLLLLTSKQATCQPGEVARLVRLQADVRKSIQQSAERLKGLVTRMQRFTNLDAADVQQADLNEILKDVVGLVEPQLPKAAKLELDLQPMPSIVCRPQQLSAVFSNLLSNAVDALNGNGRIVISTRHSGKNLSIEIRDNGRGVDPSEISRIFDPGFKVAGARVGTGNWSMFSSRQIIREHGGDIKIHSRPGQGTSVRISFPETSAIS